MQLIANGTQGPTTVPAKQTAVGTPGYAYGGPPGSTPATDLDPDVFNTVLAEMASLAGATGNALDPTNNAQARGAVKTLAGSNATGISTAGTTTLTASQAGLIEVNATAGNITINLPAPNSTGTVFRFEFLRVDSTANTVGVQTPSGSIINEPSSTTAIALPGSSLTKLICDASNYIQDGPYAQQSALSGYAALNGSSAQVFSVANAVTGTEAVPLAQVVSPARIAQYGSNGTFTVPAGVTEVLVSGCGGGAGGNSGYSGGAGQPVIKQGIAVTPGHVLSITIGAGGVGGNATATGGGNTVLTDSTTSTVLLTLAGATGGSGYSNGYPGGGNLSSGSTQPGASGPYGAGGGSGGTAAGTAGLPAYGYGAGGGQGQSAAGGNGAPGFLSLEF